MKILMIISSGWKEGGAENYLVLMRPILEKMGHTVKTLSSDARPDMPHYNDYSYKAPKGFMRPFLYSFNFSAYFTLKKILREFKPDIVHVHTVGHGSPAILFPLKNYPTVLTMHGPEGFLKSLIIYCLPTSDFKYGRQAPDELRFVGKLRYFYHRYINGLLYAIGFRNVDTIISASDYLNKIVQDDGFKSVSVRIGTKLFDYQPININDVTHTIVYVGRLEKYKGVDYLLSAMPAILKKFPDTKLFIAGNGSEKAKLEELVQELSLDYAVYFTGYVDRKGVQELFGRAAVVVIPSTWVEAFGTVGVEAMSVGRPVIATNLGGMPEWLIDGETGFLITPKNSSALADSVICMFSDHNLIVRMMANARKRSLEFGIEKHIDEIIKIYEQTIKKTRSYG